VVDYLGLIGDSSDNVPGVPGIGPKTAISLIEQYGPMEEILRRAGEISGKRAREALLANPEQALLSKRLVTIVTDLPIPLDLEALRTEDPDRDRLKEIFLSLEFHSLVRDYAAPEPAVPAERSVDYGILQQPEQAAKLVERIRELGRVSLNVETTGSDSMSAGLAGISIAVRPGEAYYLPFGHVRVNGKGSPEEVAAGASSAAGGRGRGVEREEEPSLFSQPAEDVDSPNLPAIGSEALKPLVAMLEDPAVAKVGQNLKYDLLVLRRAGITLRGIDFDTMIASYLLDPGRREHGLEALALQHLDRRTIGYEEITGKGKNQISFAEVEIERCRDYACEDADVALQLAELFAPQIQELHLEDLFRRIEMPLVEVLAEMEWAGIRIDEDFFEELRGRLAGQLGVLEQRIHETAGTTFNINSNPQLREILFERLGLPVIRKTKTGPSTDASVLEALAAQGHELPILLMEYRQLDKLQGTYVTALPRQVNRRTGRLHTSFNQTVAATGRLSSADPNLQNIPIRTEVGAEIRRGFVPAEGHVFVSADYSQIELRILAHYSGDPAFVDAFSRGEDIHRQTAALIFGVDPAQVTREMRDRAKTVNFAVIYGIGSFSLAQKLGVSNAEGKEFIGRYFERFPGVRSYLDGQIELARSQGYVQTLTGRRRYIPEISSRNFNIRSFGERVATNAPIQGTAADLIKIAMIDIHRAFRETGSPARMLLQVHDELLIETPAAEVAATLDILRARMEGAAELSVPLVVETGIGSNWLECK
jgi:DNA polymerase I